MITFKTDGELAEFLKVSRPTVTGWRNKGMPHDIVGPQRYEYTLDKCLKWLTNYSKQHAKWVEQLIKEFEEDE